MSSIIITCSSCATRNRIPTIKQHLFPKCANCGTRLDAAHQALPVELNDTNFQSFIKEAALPVMVDFYSTTCGPCKAIAPLINSFSKEYFGKVIVAKIDTGNNPGTAMHFKIRGVPSLLFFVKGDLVDQIVGAPPENQLRQKLTSLG